MTSRINYKPNPMLNGISYRWGDLYDSWNSFQQSHFDGTGVDVYAPIQQERGDPMPPLAQQWKEEYNKRHGKRTRNR